MAKKKLFTNTKVFWKAAENAKWMADLAMEAELAREKNPNIVFDSRNLMDLAPLLFDVSGLPEDQKKSYFLSEYDKMAKAFSTPSAENPKKPDPEAIKPYIKRMFEVLATDLDDVDWNNVKQVENALTSMKATQTLATLIDDFPAAALDVFPTHDAMKKIDALAAKAYNAYLEGRVKMSYANLDNIYEYVPIGPGVQKCTQMLVQAELCNAIFNSTLAGTDLVTLDPAINDLATKFYMGESFSVTNAAVLPDNEYQYTDTDYLADFMNYIAGCSSNTSFEQMLILPMRAADPIDGKAFEQLDLLMIDGKPMSEIVAEVEASTGLIGDKAKAEAAKVLREALLEGEKPVTLLTSTFTKNGNIQFKHKDIRLDHDKLNELDRKKNHNIFRRMLHNIGIWKIPEKYINNATRDIRIDVRKNSDECRAKLQAAEDRFIKIYNAIPRPSATQKGVVDMIPKLTKEPIDLAANRDSASRNINREPIHNIRLDMEKKMSAEPAKIPAEKVAQKDPLTK